MLGTGAAVHSLQGTYQVLASGSPLGQHGGCQAANFHRRLPLHRGWRAPLGFPLLGVLFGSCSSSGWRLIRRLCWRGRRGRPHRLRPVLLLHRRRCGAGQKGRCLRRRTGQRGLLFLRKWRRALCCRCTCTYVLVLVMAYSSHHMPERKLLHTAPSTRLPQAPPWTLMVTAKQLEDRSWLCDGLTRCSEMRGWRGKGCGGSLWHLRSHVGHRIGHVGVWHAGKGVGRGRLVVARPLWGKCGQRRQKMRKGRWQGCGCTGCGGPSGVHRCSSSYPTADLSGQGVCSCWLGLCLRH